MVERTASHRPADLPSWMGGPIPDGDTVPQPPRAEPEPEPEATPNRYEWRVFWLTLAVVALGVLIGVLR